MDNKYPYEYTAGNSNSQSENVQEGYPFVFDDIAKSNLQIAEEHDMIYLEMNLVIGFVSYIDL